MEELSRPDAPPSTDSTETSGESERAGSASPRPIGVLVADDDDLVRALLQAALRQHGFTVYLAADGKEALAIYHRHGRDIDLVLLDVRMPRLDGPQTLAALERLNPKICCCLMTGDLGGYTEADLLRMHAARVFQKPFLTDDLVESIRQLVGEGIGSRE